MPCVGATDLASDRGTEQTVGGLPMGIAMVVDLAHEVVSVPAEKWQRWHGIARAIDNDDCVLSQELRIANTAPTRRNLYWAATAARILVQWTTGDRQRSANAIATEIESYAVPPHWHREQSGVIGIC